MPRILEDSELTGAVIPQGMVPRKMRWFGLTIDIENPKGTWRVGDGWSTFMNWDYGYIRKVEGEDGDELDVYIGPNPATATHVYVIHQRKLPDFVEWDEDKCMIGFPDGIAAKRAYESQYSTPSFFGAMDAYEAQEFVDYVKKHHKAPGTPYVTSGDLRRQLAQLCQTPEVIMAQLRTTPSPNGGV